MASAMYSRLWGRDARRDSQDPISHMSLISFHKTLTVITRVTSEYEGQHQIPSIFPEFIQCLNYVRNMAFKFAWIWISGHKSKPNQGKQDHMELLKDCFQEKQEIPTWSLWGSFYFQVGREALTLRSKNSNRQRLVTRSQISFQLFTYGESNITNRFLFNFHRFCVFCCLFRVDNLLVFFRELLANLSKISRCKRGQESESDFRGSDGNYTAVHSVPWTLLTSDLNEQVNNLPATQEIFFPFKCTFCAVTRDYNKRFNPLTSDW